MNYINLAYLHLGAVIPAFFLGSYLLVARKGGNIHRALGKTYMVLMLVTAGISIFMPAKVGSTLLSHFGIIHVLSFLTLYIVPVAYLSAKNGNIRRHKNSMIGLYCGGILIAGTFAFMPGRFLHHWLFG